MTTVICLVPTKAVRAWSAFIALSWAIVCSATSGSAATEGLQPEVSLSLRGTWGGEVEVGESFRVAVRVDAPASLVLAPAQTSWVDATTVEIFSTDGSIIPAIARSAMVPDDGKNIVVDADNPATGLWWFPAANLTAFVPGDYIVRAKLVIRDGTGWKGEVLSEPSPVRFVVASVDPERVMQREVERARAAIVSGEKAKASEILNALLEAQPDCVAALALRAALSLDGGNRGGAHVCITRALILATRLGEEPSMELNELAISVERALSQRGGIAEIPAWARVPRVVFEPVRTERTSVPGLSAANRADPKQAGASVSVVPPVNSPTIVAKPAASVSPPVASVSLATPAVAVASAKSVGIVVPAAEFSDEKIVSDPSGQWAASATAGSQYGKSQYSANRATGAPNVPVSGNSPDAWCPAVRDKGMDWLEVTFATPVQAVEVRVRQNDAPGAVAKVEAIEADGTVHLWWEGVDPHKTASVREIVWFAVRVPKTPYLVSRIKLTLNLASGPGYKEVDAVQLVAAAGDKR